jgi:uncharacterized protein YjbI with pentapeptide repeats
VQILNHTPYRVGWIAGKVKPPSHSLTIIVKGTFALAPGAAITPVSAEEQAFLDGDRHHDDAPKASPRYDSDFALFKPRADVLLTGTCHTPGGRALPVCRAAFGVGRMYKELAVIGDRTWIREPVLGLRPGAPAPFRSMPLRYERSFGGPRDPRNPCGVGRVAPGDDAGALQRLPNIERVDQLIRTPKDAPEPAGFGPVDRRWAGRAAKLGTLDQRWLAQRWPDMPADFDAAYFNAAPADQQIAYLRGDEQLVFENLHPEHARIESRLPGQRVRCFLQADAGSGLVRHEVQLRLDTLSVDMDAGKVLLVWRGLVEVASRDHGELRKILVVAEHLAAPALAADVYADDRFWHRPDPMDAGEEAARKEREEAEAAAAAAAASPEADAGGDDMEKALQDARASLEEAGIAPSVFDALLAAPSEEAARSILSKDLGLDPKEAAEMTKQGQQRAKKLLVEHGVDPSLLDELDERDEPEVAEAAPGPRLTREALELRARAGQSCAGVDVSGLDLRRIDLCGVDLAGARFEGARLQGAKLDAADLRQARLDGADLSGASLLGALLEQARLDGANLTGAHLGSAHLTGAKLAGAVLFAAHLGGADLAGSTLTGCDLRSAWLARAELEKADLSGSNLRDAKAERARLVDATLVGADFTGAAFDRADFTGVAIDRATFSGASLRGAFFFGARGAGVCMVDADLTGARAGRGCALGGGDFRRIKGGGSFWNQSDFHDADFSGSLLDDADFSGSDLARTNFHRAVLKRANLSNSNLVAARLTKVNLFQGRLDGADLTEADCDGSNFFGCDFVDANTMKTRFVGSNLNRTVFAARARVL